MQIWKRNGNATSDWPLQIEAHTRELESVMNECKDIYMDYYPGGNITATTLCESVRSPLLRDIIYTYYRAIDEGSCKTNRRRKTSGM